MSEIGHNGGPALRDGNWIAISRDMIDHHIVGAGQVVTPADRNRGAFSRLESWLDLLMLANFAERRISAKGVTTILGPGQTIAGRAFLARRWNWSEKTVRGWLDRLQKELMISLACETLKQGHTQGHTPNVLTICNWSKYQIAEVAAGPPIGWPEGHPGATQGPNYNKGTREQVSESDSARVSASAGEEMAGHGVLVNCETIRHASGAFTISLPAIHLGIAGRMDREEVKQRCLAHALQWGAEIEGGKSQREVVPQKIANFLTASLMGEINRGATQSVRMERAKSEGGGRASVSGRASILEAIDRINAGGSK